MSITFFWNYARRGGACAARLAEILLIGVIRKAGDARRRALRSGKTSEIADGTIFKKSLIFKF